MSLNNKKELLPWQWSRIIRYYGKTYVVAMVTGGH